MRAPLRERSPGREPCPASQRCRRPSHPSTEVGRAVPVVGCDEPRTERPRQPLLGHGQTDVRVDQVRLEELVEQVVGRHPQVAQRHGLALVGPLGGSHLDPDRELAEVGPRIAERDADAPGSHVDRRRRRRPLAGTEPTDGHAYQRDQRRPAPPRRSTRHGDRSIRLARLPIGRVLPTTHDVSPSSTWPEPYGGRASFNRASLRPVHPRLRPTTPADVAGQGTTVWRREHRRPRRRPQDVAHARAVPRPRVLHPARGGRYAALGVTGRAGYFASRAAPMGRSPPRS